MHSIFKLFEMPVSAVLYLEIQMLGLFFISTRFIYYYNKFIETATDRCRGINMAKIKVRNFVLREKNGKETGVFTGNQPRQAALKAANRSKGTKGKPVELRLRERGSKKVHIFKGWKELVSAPKNKPAWMPAKINKPNVKKIGSEKLKKV